MTSRAVLALFILLGACLMVSCAGGDDRGDACGGCGPFEACCSNGDSVQCVRLSDNPQHCGMCNNPCPSGRCMSAMCVGGLTDGGGLDSGEPPGMCSPTCSSSQRCCGTTCVERQVAPGTDGRSNSSFLNCGACGIPCDTMRASACTTRTGAMGPSCSCGNFPACTGSDVCVMNSSGTYQCVSLSTDPNNCGEVGNACAMGEVCSGGMCVCGSTGARCGTGQSCCGGACIDTTTDPMNCGGCGNVCGAQGTSCQDGACRCGTGPGCRAPAGTDLGELCCADTCVPQDASNCTGCGNVCPDEQMCVLGMSLGGGTEVCCSEIAIPGFPAFCFGGGFGDGGFPFPGLDGGVPTGDAGP